MLRPAEGDESRDEDRGDLSDRDETEGENAHCENAARVLAVSHQPELDNLILNSDSALRGGLGLCLAGSPIQRMMWNCNKAGQEIPGSSQSLQLNASLFDRPLEKSTRDV